MSVSSTTLDAPASPSAESHEAGQCLNCHKALAEGPYCPHCGQQRPHRLSVGHVLHELVHVFTHADKSIFAFAGHVLLRPGRVVADYLAGRRKRYFNPFQFLLIAVGLATLLSTQLHYYELMGQDLQRAFRSRGLPAEQIARIGHYFYALGKYFNVWWLGVLPAHALLVWAVYRRKLNYAESVFTMVVVSCASQLYLMVLLVFVFKVLGIQPRGSNALIQVAAYLVYLTWIGRQGLQLSWARAVLSAAAVTLLAGLLNYGLNMLAFRWYVFGG